MCLLHLYLLQLLYRLSLVSSPVSFRRCGRRGTPTRRLHERAKASGATQAYDLLSLDTGSVMDLWHFRRGNEHVPVAARGSVIVDNVHRDMVRDLVVSGVGVARLLDWYQRPGREVASGLLVPALTEWVVDEVPPVNLLYAPSVRRTPRVRVFLDWVVQLFAEVERERLRPLPATAMPHWAKRKRRRASETL